MRGFLLVVGVSLLGCDSGGAENVPDEAVMLDLTVGNRWVYQVDWVIGPNAGVRRDTIVVLRDSSVAGEPWSLLESGRRSTPPIPSGWYANRSDGVYAVYDGDFSAAEVWMPAVGPGTESARRGQWQQFRYLTDGSYRLLDGTAEISRQILRTTERLDPPNDAIPLAETVSDTLYIRLGQGPLEVKTTYFSRGATPDPEVYGAVGHERHRLLLFSPGTSSHQRPDS